ncbi:MAG: IS200/IS605 family accessory protein TnpB-related protein, partial [Oscillospiraceae bacterium]|nr:IS200/IS605 family accessory protein TnpB-related protein [Oscillospiraceae bacterium]
SNPGWKQEVNMGKESNQKFVQIPFDKLKEILKYQGERNGIRILEQEESYTSKASFLDRDDIPNFGVESVFSGVRTNRGSYRSKNGQMINADLNGSANILRKAFPGAFTENNVPDFKNIVVIKHPDEMLKQQNK